MDVARDLAHPLEVLLAEVAAAFAEQVDDVPAHPVARRLAVVAVADR